MESPNSRGFTFVEMLIVMVLMSAVMAMAFPRLQDVAVKEAVRGARLAVGTQLAKARGAAATRGCAATLHVVQGSSARVWITSCPTTGTGIDTVGAVEFLSSKHGVTVASTLDSITFAPSGIAMAANWNVMRFAKSAYADTLSISPVGRPQW
jgi:prepilin-type N-terminal cleavage/methylation domain-containing protein